jgi:predicted Fe-Mo cluster-binding NifX family protein
MSDSSDRNKRRNKMRICVPTGTKEGLEAKVYGHFGSSPYFTIYDTETKEIKTVDNTNAHHAHGMCHPIGVLGTAKIDAVVCQGMGMKAIEKLNAAGIRAFRADDGSVKDIIKQYEANTLTEMTAANACAQHGCH